MSFITSLLGWLGLPTWGLELVAFLLVGGGVGAAVLYYHHKVYDEGIAAQIAQDKTAATKLQVAADAATQAAQQRATLAEQAYAQTQSKLDAYLNANPLHGGLCNEPHGGGSHLPQASPSKLGNANPSPPASGVQPVPTGNPVAGGSGNPDIRGMLSALAARADQVSGELREWQTR